MRIILMNSRHLGIFSLEGIVTFSKRIGMAGLVALMSATGAVHATAQIPMPPPPMPTIMPPHVVPPVRQEPQPIHTVRLILIQRGQTIMNQPMRIGGRANSNLSISEPAAGEEILCPPGTFHQPNTQQINIVITPSRYGARKNHYTINIRYSRPEGPVDCTNNAERSINLQQTFEWTGKPIDFRISDDFQVRLTQ